jgi:serine/threonine protein kinase
LGITCIELAEGQPPYADKAPMNYLFILVTDLMNSPPNLSKKDQFSSEFSDFISKCLTVSLEERYSAEQLLKVLDLNLF